MPLYQQHTITTGQQTVSISAQAPDTYINTHTKVLSNIPKILKEKLPLVFTIPSLYMGIYI